jgi:hypothetical protein
MKFGLKFDKQCGARRNKVFFRFLFLSQIEQFAIHSHAPAPDFAFRSDARAVTGLSVRVSRMCYIVKITHAQQHMLHSKFEAVFLD